MWTTLICAGINIITNYLLIQKIGVWGALVGTVLSYFLIAHIRMADVRRYVTLQINWRKYVIDVILLMVQAVIISLDYHIVGVAVTSIVIFVINNSEEIFLLIRVGKSILMKVKKN